jgi:hypothetical protein
VNNRHLEQQCQGDRDLLPPYLKIAYIDFSLLAGHDVVVPLDLEVYEARSPTRYSLLLVVVAMLRKVRPHRSTVLCRHPGKRVRANSKFELTMGPYKNPECRSRTFLFIQQ